MPLLIYISLLSMIGVIFVIFDKVQAKRHAWRVRERTLLLLAFFGGACAMLIAMRIIRHKTKKPKFMIGLPLMAVVHIALLLLYFFYY